MNIPTALEIFSNYITINESGEVNVSKVFSRLCYLEWLETRKKQPKCPAPAFRKVLTGHVRGDKGLTPFTPVVETEVLRILRQKKVWECFEGTEIKIGLRGYQSTGYWESKHKSRKRRAESLDIVPAKRHILQGPPIPEKELNDILLALLYCQTWSMTDDPIISYNRTI